MDVLHVTHQFAPETRGGVESYLFDLASEQQRQGLDVQVLTGSHEPWPGIGIEELRVGGLRVHRLHRDDWYFDLHSKAWHPGIAAFVGDLLARWRPRIVHVHQWIRLTSDLVEVIQRQGIPAVVTLHDFYSSCPRAFRMRPGQSACLRPVSPASCGDCVPRYGHEPPEEIAEGIELFAAQMRGELTAADAVLVAVSTTADLVARTLGVDRERLLVLPLGYRRRFAGRPALPPPRAGEAFRFAFWGGVARHKGIDVLIDAFARLVPDARAELHVLGGFATPDYEQELRQRAGALPVRFHGPFTIEELLAVAPHAGVFPSTCLETFGFVLDECFELGLPAIVADHGALTTRAGGGALRVRPGDAADLVAAMGRLVREAGTWERLQRERPAPPPDIETHCRALAGIYRRAAAARAAAPPVQGAVPLQRRFQFLQLQRESALRCIAPRDVDR